MFLPYFIIPSIVWIFNNLLYIFFNFNRFGRTLTVIELMNQFLTGTVFHRIFWFQFVIIFLTVLFLIISFSFKGNYLIIIQLFGIISLILQSSGHNYKYFYKYKKNSRLGSIAELFPHSVIGVSFGEINLIKILQKFRLRVICICCLFLYFIYQYDIFKNLQGINYPGILFPLGGMLLFIIFSLIFTLNNTKEYLMYIIKICSNYTAGIYYYHSVTVFYLRFITQIKNRTFIGSIIIYIVTYLICFNGNKIFGKNDFKYLFS